MIGLLMLASSMVSQPSVKPVVEYERQDSLEVVQLLKDSKRVTALDYARFLKGRPYVAHTLERGSEHLVVNLRGLDCATLVETSTALALARKAKGDPWKNYCKALQQLRYFDGRIDGYLSRLHYVTFWIHDHLRRGDAEEVQLPSALTKEKSVTINYMSRHPASYPRLMRKNGQPLKWAVDSLAAIERRNSGHVMRYLPQENCGLSQKQLSAIHDGDILYIVTSKQGLDYSHQGFAFWGKDGKLHMLHASSDRKKVIEDERPLEEYLKKINSSLGVRIFRMKG